MCLTISKKQTKIIWFQSAFYFCLQNNFFYNTLLIFAILCVNTPFSRIFITFSKIFSIFSKKFSKCAPFCGFHYTIYMEHKKSDLISGRNNGFIHILLIFGIVLCRIAIPPAINSARCRSMIYFLSPARHTLLSHVASGEKCRAETPSVRNTARRHSCPFWWRRAVFLLYKEGS